MGSQLVKKSVKGKSTPARQMHQDDADEYAEDEFEDPNNQEDNEPIQSNNAQAKIANIQKQRSKDPSEGEYLN